MQHSLRDATAGKFDRFRQSDNRWQDYAKNLKNVFVKHVEFY